jgi:hypothetical protein
VVVAPRSLRRALWTANVGLAALAAFVWGGHLLVERAPVLPIVPHEPARVLVHARHDIDLAEMEAALAWMYGTAEETAPVTLLAPVSDRLPLGAFRVALWIHLPTAPDVIALVSKDPAHPERHYLREGEAGPLEIVSLERTLHLEHVFGRVTVRRGDEVCTFDVPWGVASGRGIRVVPRAPRPTAPPALSERAREILADVRFVPFRGPDAKFAGMRVTGVRRDSAAARAGLEVGDVVRGVGGQPLSEPGALMAALGGGGPVELAVARFDDPKARSLRIAR